MPKPSKRKSNTKPSTSPTSTSSSNDIPRPFTKAPDHLQPFLTNLPSDHIYITSLDNHPRAFKRRLFSVPLLLNIFLSIVVLYRIYVALPTYLSILTAAAGYDSPHKLDVHRIPALGLLGVGFERTMMFLGDFILLRFIGMWPLDFFLGSGLFGREVNASPVAWRRAVTFADVELVVRRSRKWDREVYYREKVGGEETVNAIEEVLAEGLEGKLVNERVLPAVEQRCVKEKTAYQMLDKSWDLYFSGMIEAHALVEEGTNKFEDFKTGVFVFTERCGWLIWEVWREHEDGLETQNSKYLQGVKDTLTALGKENLFFRVIEVLQSETSQAGDFTVDRRQKAIDKIREEFSDQKIDFEEFWEGVGGIDSMPGLQAD
ncbi:uncharacterized protein KY384_000738 [Bacidia gigantensis]|uniref:uncharacterized protein n=1 Tax=Bacidia gigantensis TaxID=2732470 RepID=UPI001D052B7C|nr:uncharacterized protein KY384_000738 [Bacidia gigantensis]KAG8525976.1 hypothetical protein KY384_000738 [Bacidia gigantensis]